MKEILSKYKNYFIGGTASIGAFTSIVFTYIDAKTDAITIQLKAELDNNRDVNLEKINAINKQLDNIESILVRIYDRIYNLTKGK